MAKKKTKKKPKKKKDPKGSLTQGVRLTVKTAGEDLDEQKDQQTAAEEAAKKAGSGLKTIAKLRVKKETLDVTTYTQRLALAKLEQGWRPAEIELVHAGSISGKASKLGTKAHPKLDPATPLQFPITKAGQERHESYADLRQERRKELKKQRSKLHKEDVKRAIVDQDIDAAIRDLTPAEAREAASLGLISKAAAKGAKGKAKKKAAKKKAAKKKAAKKKPAKKKAAKKKPAKKKVVAEKPRAKKDPKKRAAAEKAESQAEAREQLKGKSPDEVITLVSRWRNPDKLEVGTAYLRTMAA